MGAAFDIFFRTRGVDRKKKKQLLPRMKIEMDVATPLGERYVVVKRSDGQYVSYVFDKFDGMRICCTRTPFLRTASSTYVAPSPKCPFFALTARALPQVPTRRH